MEKESTFEALLASLRTVLERYVNFRMPTRFDAEDVLQETCLAAFLHFGELRDPALFLPWILSIARNECRLWYRKHYGREDVSLDEIADVLAAPVPEDPVSDVLSGLPEEDAVLLRLTMEGWKQTEIADRLKIPLGTVKSRLYHAKKRFRDASPRELIESYERENRIMEKKEFLHGFPPSCPALSLEKTDAPFFPVDTADEAFILPIVGNRNAEGTYRFGKLALVSDCRVVKRAVVHEVEGVKIVRDTFNLRADRMYRNERVWFTQLTDEYVRDLGTLYCDSDGDEDIPTFLQTFLDEEYDVIVNGPDRIHGRPRQLAENPAEREGENYVNMDQNLRYTDGIWIVTVGKRRFECVKTCVLHDGGILDERYTDRSGRLVLMRTWETEYCVREFHMYSEERIVSFLKEPFILVNGERSHHTEDRVSEYAL